MLIKQAGLNAYVQTFSSCSQDMYRLIIKEFSRSTFHHFNGTFRATHTPEAYGGIMGDCVHTDTCSIKEGQVIPLCQCYEYVALKFLCTHTCTLQHDYVYHVVVIWSLSCRNLEICMHVCLHKIRFQVKSYFGWLCVCGRFLKMITIVPAAFILVHPLLSGSNFSLSSQNDSLTAETFTS